jgi:hypothetical protein
LAIRAVDGRTSDQRCPCTNIYKTWRQSIQTVQRQGTYSSTRAVNWERNEIEKQTKNRVIRGSNERWKRFALRTPTMLWCVVGTQYKKQKLPRTGGGAYVLNRSFSISRKHGRHATRQHRHVAMVVLWVLWRKPNTDAAQRTNKTGAVTSEGARRRKKEYPNRSGEQQSTTEVRGRDRTGGPTELFVQKHGRAERKC